MKKLLLFIILFGGSFLFGGGVLAVDSCSCNMVQGNDSTTGLFKEARCIFTDNRTENVVIEKVISEDLTVFNYIEKFKDESDCGNLVRLRTFGATYRFPLLSFTNVHAETVINNESSCNSLSYSFDKDDDYSYFRDDDYEENTFFTIRCRFIAGSQGTLLSEQPQPETSSTTPQPETPSLTGDQPTSVPLINPLGGSESDPEGNTDIAVIFGNILKKVLGLLGSITLVVFVAGSFQWLTSGGQSDKIQKGGKTMLYAAVGLFIIFGSYAILNTIIQALT